MSTPKLGAGFQPAGTTPAGLGTPNEADVMGGELLVDRFGKATGSRLVDSVTRRYVFDADGRMVGEDDLRHLIKMCVLTVRGSSAWSGGLRPFGGTIGAAYQQRVQSYYREALAPLTGGDSPLILILSITVKRVKQDALSIHLLYKDLLNNKTDSLEVG